MALGVAHSRDGLSYFWLDPKVTKRSSRNTAALRALSVLYAAPLHFAPLSTAKPPFPPAPARTLRQGPRSRVDESLHCSAHFLAEASLLTG
ncbi:hypothetical protein KXQ82_15535 [Mucilaginibacter sp. HMF5004]|uniref:hypothetical protein n=1 Tax=Mucilaginibacter rivuli TaxID=2857527 RepID=UPI001C5F287F|nr:hypothetical protein [Mucilaginibacter rivuli]MBW4891137.1 hypothetical protein [Mucilaginibacter rivuli]